MNTSDITAARFAVLAVSSELKQIESGIAFALANPAEVTRQELANLRARALSAVRDMEAKLAIYDALVAKSR